MKKIIKEIQELLKGLEKIDIIQDTFDERIILNLGENHEVHIYGINPNGIECFVCGENIETVIFKLPFEVLSIDVLKNVLNITKSIQYFR